MDLEPQPTLLEVRDRYMRLFSRAVKFIRCRYPEWNGTADGSTITLTGCANMVADFVQEDETVDWNEVTKALVDKTGWKSSQPLIVSLKKS